MNYIVTLMGKRYFIGRISLGAQSSLHVHTTFSVFGFLWYGVDVLISGGTVFLPKHFLLQDGLCFRDCELSEIYISLSFLYHCDTL